MSFVYSNDNKRDYLGGGRVIWWFRTKERGRHYERTISYKRKENGRTIKVHGLRSKDLNFRVGILEDSKLSEKMTLNKKT